MCVGRGYQATEHFSPTSGGSGGIGDFPKDPLHPVKKEIGTELLCLIVPFGVVENCCSCSVLYLFFCILLVSFVGLQWARVEREAEANRRLLEQQAAIEQRQYDQQVALIKLQAEIGEKATMAYREGQSSDRKRDRALFSVPVLREGDDVEEFLVTAEGRLKVAEVGMEEWIPIINSRLSGKLAVAWQDVTLTVGDYQEAKDRFLKMCGYTPMLAADRFYGFKLEHCKGLTADQLYHKGQQLLRRMIAPGTQTAEVEYAVLKGWVGSLIPKRARAAIDARVITSAAELVNALQDFLVLEGDRCEGQAATFKYKGGEAFRERGTPITCFKCGKVGHKAVDCWKGGASVAKGGVTATVGVVHKIICYNCGEEGHKSPQCPKLAKQEREVVKGARPKPVKRVWRSQPKCVQLMGVVDEHATPILLDSAAAISVVPESLVAPERLAGGSVAVKPFGAKKPILLPIANVSFKIGDLEWVERVAVAPEQEGAEEEVLYSLDLQSERGLKLVLMVNEVEPKEVLRVTTRAQAKSEREEQAEEALILEQEVPKPVSVESTVICAESEISNKEEVVGGSLGRKEEELKLILGLEKDTYGDDEEVGVKLEGRCEDFDESQVEVLQGEYPDVFNDVPGRTEVCSLEIVTGATPPIASGPYRVPDRMKEEVKKEVEKLLELGVAEPSHSPWASPIVPVLKKDGSIRLCIDYRKLNSVTAGDPYYMVTLEEILEKVGNSRCLSKLDLSKGFYQIGIEEGSREKTAFITPFGKYCFNRMPFGLRNAPAIFQRGMEVVLRGCYDCASPYIDDILVFSVNEVEHLEDLRRVLEALRKGGMTVKRAKCEFGRSTLEYLGHQIGNGTLAVPRHRATAMNEFKLPRTKRQLRSFLGAASYYRRFVKHFSNHSGLLSPATSKLAPSVVKWSEDMLEAFNFLKGALVNVCVLTIPSQEDCFSLHTDASGLGIGATLNVVRKGEELPVAYYSKQLQGAQKHYSATELEGLAVFKAVNFFDHFLYGQHFTILTDHSALVYLLKSKRLNKRLYGWMLRLLDFSFTIEYKPGRLNQDADGLPRQAWSSETEDLEMEQPRREEQPRAAGNLVGGDVGMSPTEGREGSRTRSSPWGICVELLELLELY